MSSGGDSITRSYGRGFRYSHRLRRLCPAELSGRPRRGRSEAQAIDGWAARISVRSLRGVIGSACRRIGRLGADIDLLDKHLVEIVGTDAALAHRYQLLTSMPGVGP
jgi:hypothetical protein